MNTKGQNRRTRRAPNRNVARSAQRVPPAVRLPQTGRHSIRGRQRAQEEPCSPLAHHRAAHGQRRVHRHAQAHTPLFVSIRECLFSPLFLFPLSILYNFSIRL